MKKTLTLLLCICMILTAVPAYAAEDQKLEAQVTGTRLLQKWNGQTSEETDWFCVDLKLTNWHTDPQNIPGLLSGTLIFQKAYSFDAVPEFEEDTIAPLIEREGSLVFEIPKMVSRMFSPDNIRVLLTVDGEEMEVDTENISSTPAMPSGTLEGPGFDTPEDAVLAYLEGLNNGDVKEMLSTFAYETYAEHANPEDMLRRIRSFMYGQTSCVPMNSDYAKSIVINGRYADLARPLVYNYVECSYRTEGRAITFDEESEMTDFLNAFAISPANEWLGNVEFVEWIDPAQVTDKFFMSMNLRNLATQMACAGADDYAELVAHIKLNGVDSAQFMECIKYGDRWYNHSFQSMMANILGLAPTTAGLVYPDKNSEAGNLQDYLIVPEIDEEMAAARNSWDTSDLPGTRWQLESVKTSEFAANVGTSKEEVLADSGNSIFGELKFMHLGGAVLDMRFSPGLCSEMEVESTYAKSTMIWAEIDGQLQIGECKGISASGLQFEEAECKRTEDQIIINVEGDEMVFRRAQ